MNMFKMKSEILTFSTFELAFKEISLNEKDLIITIKEIYDEFLAGLINTQSKIIFVGDYGLSEPTSFMIDAMIKDIGDFRYSRVIAIGGGSVIDIAKIFVLKDISKAVDIFEQKIPIIKEKDLLIFPTTCGTGSEVTNISIAFLEEKNVKMGLANDAILADKAILVPQGLEKLPFKAYVCSAIDALIHALESYLSPKANIYTEIFSKEAIKIILKVFTKLVKEGFEARFEYMNEMLIASNMAGIAFGNAGVGAVHAMSYPLGGNYHVPHGESNYQFLVAVFKAYQKKNPDGKIKDLNLYLSKLLEVDIDKVYSSLSDILNKLVEKKPLKDYGMKEDEIELFADTVIKTQQRLLANNYVALSRDEIRDIYKEVY